MKSLENSVPTGTISMDMPFEDGSPPMSDPDATQGRPVYWQAAEAMSFGELRRFMDDALDAVQEGNAGEASPCTREEFVVLADLLEAKNLRARAEVPLEPPELEQPPGYDPQIHSYRRGEFQESDELSEMNWELSRLDDRIEDARSDRTVPKWSYYHMRQEARDLRRRIKEREEEEMRTWPARYAAHEKVRPGYKDAVRRRNQEAQRINKRLGVLDRQQGFAERIRRSIDSAFAATSSGVTGRIRWAPFQSAKPTRADIRRHYRDHLRRQGKEDKFDQRRLDAATDLPYIDWLVPDEGFGGFDAYGIFTIEGTSKVLLECPIYGNAAYVVDADQEVWKGMRKRELIESGLAKQIPHRGEDWRIKIRQALGIE